MRVSISCLTAVLLLTVLAGCDSTAPDAAALAPGTYVLVSVGGRALPALVERTTEVCDSNPSRDYVWIVEARGGTVVIEPDGRAEVTLDRMRVCENDREVRVPSRIVASGRSVSAGRLLLDNTTLSLSPATTGNGGFTTTASGAVLGPAAQELRFAPALPTADPTGRWTGQAIFELDTTYAYRTSPDVRRRQQLYRRFDLEFDLRTEGDSVLGTGRFVSYFERITTIVQTGEVFVIGGRDVQQDDRTFDVSGTRENQILSLRMYGQGVLLDWRGHPVVLEDGTLRTAFRNFEEGSYYASPSQDVTFTRTGAITRPSPPSLAAETR